jgi:hypothetical protein
MLIGSPPRFGRVLVVLAASDQEGCAARFRGNLNVRRLGGGFVRDQCRLPVVQVQQAVAADQLKLELVVPLRRFAIPDGACRFLQCRAVVARVMQLADLNHRQHGLLVAGRRRRRLRRGGERQRQRQQHGHSNVAYAEGNFAHSVPVSAPRGIRPNNSMAANNLLT